MHMSGDKRLGPMLALERFPPKVDLKILAYQWLLFGTGFLVEMGGLREKHLQEELIGISTNDELKIQLRNGYQQFWLQKPVTFLALWRIARKILIDFSSSYCVEKGFSTVVNLLTKKRNRLEITDKEDLRLNLTNLEPTIENLLSNHLAYPSH
ncbi:protein FAM200A-like [Sipha flava]|uniref:Protein FAM200A-like n=1 Tax=Sipha flava TaxID=143950 RepID=A0A8B8FBV3_9HEMI|nr:protein FAM200A-like [Sipha flava]